MPCGIAISGWYSEYVHSFYYIRNRVSVNLFVKRAKKFPEIG